ncbi:hypothetical protein PFISCL1PPCAC_23802, partial [Pristionchus fissidentatus]
AAAAAVAASGQSSFDCEICGRSFTTLSSLGMHRTVHYTFKCNLCGKKVADKEQLERHILASHSDGDEGGESSGSPAKRRRSDIDPAEEGKRYKCDLCGGSFQSRTALNTHQLRHEGLRPFKCHLCSFDFPNKSLLKGHFRTVHGIKPYDCISCAAAFYRHEELMQHRRAEHEAPAAPAAAA